jgi:hypothetical protein
VTRRNPPCIYKSQYKSGFFFFWKKKKNFFYATLITLMANQSKQKKQSAPTKAKPAQKKKKVSHPTEPSIPVNPVPLRRARVQTEEEAEAELGDTIVIDDNEEETDDIPVIAIASDPEDNAEEDAEAQLGKHEPES